MKETERLEMGWRPARWTGIFALVGWFMVLHSGYGSESREAPASGLMLAREGKALAEIIVAEAALPQVKFAAQELHDHIQQASGVSLPIVHRPGSQGAVPVYVGESEWTRALGLSLEGLPLEGFRIVATDQYLALLGGDRSWPRIYEEYRSPRDLEKETRKWQEFAGEAWDLPRTGLYDPRNYNAELGFSVYDPTGTLFAVYDFLEQLGVRWYMPYELGTVIPDLPTVVAAPQDVSTEPVYSYRFMRWGGFPSGDLEGFLWFKRQKLGMSELIWMCHATSIATAHTGETHPEYRAITNGVSNPGKRDAGGARLAPPLGDALIRVADKFFQYVPSEVTTTAAAPNDGFVKIDDRDVAAGWDRKERGPHAHLSDYVWRFVNHVAEGVQERHPDKYVMGLAYSGARGVPEEIESLHPNVSVTYCQNRGLARVNPDERAAQEKERRDWLKKLPSGRFYVWEYYLFHEARRGLPGVPVVFTQIMQDDARLLRGVSRGEYVECSYGPGKMLNPALNHYPYQVQARLYWDPDLDLDACLTEYCTLFYGPAAEEMKTFFQFAEEVWMRDAPRALGGDGFLQEEDTEHFADILSRAAKRAGDSVYGKRVALVAEECEPMLQAFRGKSHQAKGEEALGQGDAAAARKHFREAADGSADSNSKMDSLLALVKVQNEMLQDREGAIETWLEIWEIPSKSLVNTKRSHRLDALLNACRTARNLGQLDLAASIAARREPQTSHAGYWNFQFLSEQAAIAEAVGDSAGAVKKLEEALLEKNVTERMRENARKAIARLSTATGQGR